MPAEGPEWRVEFFTKADGSGPPKDFISNLDAKDHAKISSHLRLLRDLGVRISEPHAKKIKGHEPLWELRPMPTRLIYFAYTGRRFIILHAFTKKKNKLDPNEIKIAETRLAEFPGERKVIKNIRLEDWEAEQMKDPEFRTALENLEPAYQVARLRMEKGLTQAQLAEMVGTKQSSIARLESGAFQPRLSFLRRVITALNGQMKIEIVSECEIAAKHSEAPNVVYIHSVYVHSSIHTAKFEQGRGKSYPNTIFNTKSSNILKEELTE